MEVPMSPLPLAGFALLALFAVACTPAPRREAHWVTTTGQPVDRAALRAAATECESHVAVRTRTGPFKGSVEWGLAMLDCLREAGYVQAYDDPNEKAPDAPAD
jgi:hypothetical protein